MLVGINLNSIEAKKSIAPKGNIKIDNNTEIKGITEIAIPVMKEKVNKIEFQFKTRYTQEKKQIGDITINGEVLYKGKNAELKRTWKKSKKLPEDIALEIMNGIIRRCFIRAIDIAEQIALPPPVNLPVIIPKKPQDTEYIG